MPSTREVLRWNASPIDLVKLAGLALGGALLVTLDRASLRLQAWVDTKAGR